MTTPPTLNPIHHDEQLREALLALHHEREILSQAHRHNEHLLQALESLLDSRQRDDDAYTRVFDALGKIFTFRQVLLLVQTDAQHPEVECLIAQPHELVGCRWPVADFFTKIMGGKATTTFDNRPHREWQDQARLRTLGLDARQPALYAPLSVRGTRGLMILLRDIDEPGFSRHHVHLARRFSVLAAHALAAQFASQDQAESVRLRKLSLQLRASERAAQRNADLLTKLMDALPIGITVQDHRGCTILSNDAAARMSGKNAMPTPAHALFESGRDAQHRDFLQRQFSRRLRSHSPTTTEIHVNIAGEPRTLLHTQKAVALPGESVLITTLLDISERKRIETEMTYRAYHDSLTGLPNRALIEERTNALLGTLCAGDRFALAFIDLDQFKQVNDCYSHHIGDQLLIGAGQRIQQLIRSTDMLARISGDEFLLLVYPLLDPAELSTLMVRIGEALREPFVIDGQAIMSSASMGASIYPEHGQSYEALRRTADSAMSLAKQSHKGGSKLFDPQLAQAVTERMALEQRLRTAIHAGHFRAALQPKVMVNNGDVVGFEALVRWVEPDGKVNMPGMFISMATELGLIDDITQLVVKDVLRALPLLRQQFGPEVSVSVNIGAAQAGQVQYMQSLIQTIEASGEAGHVVLEITEDALLATQCFQKQVLPELRRVGLRMSIDDFGTGYSSLAILTDITADEVKVDRAFITDIHARPRSQGILKAIESLCTALGIAMVAEGVETAQELSYLQQHTAITQAQGYLFGKPAFLEHWVQQTASRPEHSTLPQPQARPRKAKTPPRSSLAGSGGPLH